MSSVSVLGFASLAAILAGGRGHVDIVLEVVVVMQIGVAARFLDRNDLGSSLGCWADRQRMLSKELLEVRGDGAFLVLNLMITIHMQTGFWGFIYKYSVCNNTKELKDF